MKKKDIIKDIIKFEKKYSKIFFKSGLNIRKSFSDVKLKNNLNLNSTYKIKIDNVVFHFNLKSFICRAAILNSEQNRKYFFEPQTTKLLKILNKKNGNTVIGGAFIGDHACLLANRNNNIYAFEADKQNFKFLKKNKNFNKLKNLKIFNLCLYKKDNVFLKYKNNDLRNQDQAHISFIKNLSKSEMITTKIDSFIKNKNIKKINTIVLDIEGGELDALIGAKKTLNFGVKNIIFEIHSQFIDFSKGLNNLKIIKFLKKYNYSFFAIRDDHDNVGTYNKIELIPLNKVYYKGPKHGFNIFATKDKKILKHINIKIVNKKFSPKYLLYKENKIFHPVN